MMRKCGRGYAQMTLDITDVEAIRSSADQQLEHAQACFVAKRGQFDRGALLAELLFTGHVRNHITRIVVMSTVETRDTGKGV